MLNEKTYSHGTLSLEADLDRILKMAKQAHENYLIKDSEKDLKKAIEYYLEVMRLNPSIPEAYYKLAHLMWEQGCIDISYAMEQCKKAISLDPNSSAARLHMGYFLKTAGMFDEAENEFKQSIKLGGLLAAKPRIALGTSIIQKLQHKKPSLKEFVRGMYYFLTGVMMIVWDYPAIKMLFRSVFEDIKFTNYTLSGKVFKRLKNYNAAIKVFEDAAEKTGKTELFYSEIGDLSIEAGNPYNAVKYYRNAINNAPDNIVLWAKLANTLKTYYDSNVAEIKECYSKLAELDPSNAKIYYELGHLYIKLEDHLNSMNAFKKACDLDQSNPYYHNSFAFSLIQLKDYDGAISEYQKAVKLNPNNEWTSIVSQALGAIYHQVKRNHEAAVVSYQTSIALDPKNIDAVVCLGELYHEADDFDNAIDCYCEAIRVNPQMDNVFCNLGMALWEKDFPEEAIIAYQNCININPLNELAYNNMGVTYLDGIGRTEDAVASFVQALKCNPNFALAYYNLGRAYQVLGKKKEAAENYQMAIDINCLTDEFDSQDAEDRLYSLFQV